MTKFSPVHRFIVFALFMAMAMTASAQANVAPVAGDDTVSTPEDVSLNSTVITNDSDVDGPSANYTLVANAVNGLLTFNPDGSYAYLPALNFNGVDSFTYSLCDGGTPDLCDTARVYLTVTVVNDAPIAVHDSNSTMANTVLNGTVAPNDSDIDGPARIYTLADTAFNGVVTVASDGAFTYAPDLGFAGIDSFTYSLCDGGTPDLCDTASVVISIIAPNTPPSISNDSIAVNEDNPVSGAVITVTDSDPDGTTLTANTTPVSGPSYGTIAIAADGSYTYTPNANFNGLDAVIISVCDSGLPLPAICRNDTLIINVLPVNDAPTVSNDVNTTVEDTPVSGAILTVSDTDPDGTILTATTVPVSGPASGAIVINPDGTYTYTPTLNFNGTDVIIIAVCDSGTPLPAICENDTLTITVTSVNDAPVIANDINTTNEDAPVSGTILTGADNDPDGTTLHANTTLISPPAHGTIFINASGNYTYIPFADFNGTDVIIIAVCDSGTPLPSLCSNDTLTITVTPVNDAPVALSDTNSTVEALPVSGTVATNDSDIDGPSANYSVVSGPSHGTLVLNGNGSYTYTPGAGYTGVDTFTYALCDGGTPDLCDTALVLVTVRIRNTRPDAVNDTITTAEDNPITGSVGTNDIDPDGPGALFGVNTQPSHGTLSLGVNGQYTYTPAANYNGIDSFSYVLCDGGIPNLCDTATVYINTTPVNDAPVANDDNNTTSLNTAVTGDAKPNDSDVDGPSATYSLASAPVHGALVLTDSGTYLYTPSIDFVGCDTAMISLCDGGIPNLCDTSLLVICTTSGNVAPGAGDDYGQTLINTGVTINVLANDTDVNGNIDSLPTVLSDPKYGTLIENADGSITYTPSTDFTGIDTFSYIICDGGTPVLCDTAQVFVTVVRPAGIVGVPIVTQTDSSVITCLLYTAVAYDSTGTGATVSCTPAHGTAVINSIDSVTHQICFTYTPGAGYTGLDTFCITLCQGGSCSSATFPVTVNSATNTCYWLKGISPNGDGQNDDFYINCNDSYPNATLKVFNRWGDQVWDSNGHYTNNFEGNNGRGEVLADGTYYYIYYLNDGSKGQHAGFIQVSR